MAERKYININSSYGLTGRGKIGWSTVEEVLNEMDRLGIWQTVMEFSGGGNAMYCNRTVLKDLEKLDAATRARIIPVFVANMGLLFQNNAMEQFTELLKSYRPCCVALTPRSARFTLHAIEAVLEKISDLNPVLLIEYAELKNADKSADDLVWLANRFPNMRFVIRQITCSGWPFIVNVMQQTKNVYMGISRMHTAQAIELACENFGADRVLFGQSLCGNGGASMGAIEYADVSEETKEKIRCLNFINLFSDPKDREILTANLRCVEDKVANSLWRPFIEGKGVTKAELYDVNTHLGDTGSYGYVKDLTFESQLNRLETEMKRFNIKKTLSAAAGIMDPVTCHLEIEAAVKGKEDEFQGYVLYNPNYEELYTDEFLAERFATGYYVGLKTVPEDVELNIRDKKYERMFQYAHDHGLAILLHTDDGSKGNPLHCAEMAARYPNAKVILGHSGCTNKGRAMCAQIAQNPNYSNVYFEFSGSFLSNIPWSKSLEVIDYKRVLYGTDAPSCSVVWELARLLSDDIPDEKLAAILGGNAKELFGF